MSDKLIYKPDPNRTLPLDIERLPGTLARFGDFELDYLGPNLRRRERNEKVALKAQPLHYLMLLVGTAPHNLVHQVAQRFLWPDGPPSNFANSIHQAVSKLRATLGDDAKNPRYIHTEKRLGYACIPTVTWSTPRAEASESSGDENG